MEKRFGDFDQSWVVYRITERGEAWLLDNQAKLELRTRHRPTASFDQRPPASADNFSQSAEISDDDIPF